MNKIAAVILNYNSSADCAKCVASLKKQQDVELGIIIVDNCSAPDDRAAVEELCRRENCVFIANNENRGYNAGNNVGLRYASANSFEYALVANPDVELVDENYLSELSTVCQNDRSVVVCAGDVITAEGIHQNPKYIEQNDNKPFFLRLFTGGGTQTPVDSKTSRYVKYLNGSCILLSIDFLKSINYFDERVFLYGEESILACQVENAGKRMYYLATVCCRHNHKKSRENKSAITERYWKQSRLILIRHHSKYPPLRRRLEEFRVVCFFAGLRVYHFIKETFFGR